MSATNLDRIAALEARAKALEERLAALEGSPPARDPASTTAASQVISARPSRLLSPRDHKPTFGFGPPDVRATMGPERAETAPEPISVTQVHRDTPSVIQGRTERPGGAA